MTVSPEVRSHPDSPAAATQPASLFVARQPIFDRDQKVFGYELLFREGLENFFSTSDVEAACRHTLDSSFLMGLDELCGGARIFINCTRAVLLSGYITLLPAPLTVIEVLETVSPDAQVQRACAELKHAGYVIALDDFVAGDTREPLTAVADMIKLDWLALLARAGTVWLNDTPSGTFACSPKKWRPRRNSMPLSKWISPNSRDISFSGRLCFRPQKCHPTN